MYNRWMATTTTTTSTTNLSRALGMFFIFNFYTILIYFTSRLHVQQMNGHHNYHHLHNEWHEEKKAQETRLLGPGMFFCFFFCFLLLIFYY